MGLNTALLATMPPMAKAGFVDTVLHARLRRGLLNALDEKDWRVAHLARKANLANSTLSNFLNGKAGIGIESLQACLRAFGLTPEQFFVMCDQSWQPGRLKPAAGDPHATIAPTKQQETVQALIDTLKSTTETLAQFAGPAPAVSPPPSPDTLRHRLRHRKSSR